MEIQHYRFNRADGMIYREVGRGIQPINTRYLDAIILHATPPVFGQPFPNMSPQDWIGLCFLDFNLDWSYALLSSGKSNALRSFLNYRQNLEYPLNSVITRITLDEQSSSFGNTWFMYEFDSLSLPDDFDGKAYLENVNYPLIDAHVKLPFPDPPSLDEIRNQFPSIISSKPDKQGIIDLRTQFIIWD